MGALLERIASPAALADSWKRVLANDADAVQEVARLRERDSATSCGPMSRMLPHYPGRPAQPILDVLVPDPDLMAIVNLLLTRPLRGPARRRNRPGIGLSQGSPLSPILANLTLEHFDDRLRRAGYPVVRYCRRCRDLRDQPR